jgi:hypothetical protein
MNPIGTLHPLSKAIQQTKDITIAQHRTQETAGFQDGGTFLNQLIIRRRVQVASLPLPPLVRSRAAAVS